MPDMDQMNLKTLFEEFKPVKNVNLIVRCQMKDRFHITAARKILLLLVCILGIIGAGSADSDGDHGGDDSRAIYSNLFNDRPFFSHIHGAGFSVDGGAITVAAHDGLWFYEDGNWSHRDLPAHDYMGFALVEDGFYASGHPDQTTELQNPLGLVKVTEDGKRVSPIRFTGTLDFHAVAAGLSTQSIYVYNEEGIRGFRRGLHFSGDRGVTWRPATGYPGRKEPLSMAAHPTHAGTAAALISDDVYLSEDYGRNFSRIEIGVRPLSVYFHPDGKRLLVGGTILQSYDLENGSTTILPSPKLIDDLMSHVAVNCTNFNQMVIVTEKRIIYASDDKGESWSDIITVEDDHADIEGAEEAPCECGS